MEKKTKKQTKEKVETSKDVVEVKAKIDALVDYENSKTKAFASITIGDMFAVHGVRVMESDKGLFVRMPQRKVGENYVDIFHGITKEAWETTNQAVLDAYEQKLSEEQNEQVSEEQTQTM